MADSIPDMFVGLATEAVEAWDGVDNGDLIRLLAEYLGVSLYEIKGIVEKLMAEDVEAYHRDSPALAIEPGQEASKSG